MYRKILVQVDPARPLHQAPGFAEELASRTDAELVALYVVDEELSSMMGSDLVRTMDQALSAVGEDALEMYRQKVGKDVRLTKAIGYGDTATTIAKYVQRHGVDLVVTGGFHAAVYQRIPFGSVVNEIVRRTHASVFLYRDSHPNPFRPGPVVTVYDGSLPARRALHVAAELAKTLEQTLDVIHVHGAKGKTRAQQLLVEVEDLATRLPVETHTHLVRRTAWRGTARSVLRHARTAEAPYLVLPREGARRRFGSGGNPLVEYAVIHTDRPLLVVHG